MSELEEGTIKSVEFIPSECLQAIELCEAAKTADLKLICKHIGNRTELNVIDGFGKSALHYACKYGHYEVVKLLVANKANVNISDPNRTSPLHLAAKGDYQAIVKLLVLSGANVNATCLSGCTPVDFAPYESESWKVLVAAAHGVLPSVEYLTQTRSVPLVPAFAIQREVDKKKEADKKGKKGKKGGKKQSGKKKKKK